MASPEANYDQNALIFQDRRMSRHDTEAFTHLEGSRRFATRFINHLTHNPDEITNLSINGVSGVGKETVGGHFINYIESNQRFKNWLSQNGKELEITYVSFADVHKLALTLGLIKHPIGENTLPELASVAVLFRDVVSVLNAQDRDQNKVRVVMIESPDTADNGAAPINLKRKNNHTSQSVHKSGLLVESETQKISPEEQPQRNTKKPRTYLGTFALRFISSPERRKNHFSIALVRNDEVFENTNAWRGYIESALTSDLTKEELKKGFEKLCKERGIEWEGFDIDKLSQYKSSMGSPEVVKTQSERLNAQIIEAGITREIFPDDFVDKIDSFGLERDAQYRARVEAAYLRGLLEKRYNVLPENLLVAENTKLNSGHITIFREVVNRHRVNLSAALQKYYERYSTPLHQAPASFQPIQESRQMDELTPQ